VLPPEKARDVWKAYLDMEHIFGDLSSVSKIEKRRAAAYPDEGANAFIRQSPRHRHKQSHRHSHSQLRWSVLRQHCLYVLSSLPHNSTPLYRCGAVDLVLPLELSWHRHRSSLHSLRGALLITLRFWHHGAHRTLPVHGPIALHAGRDRDLRREEGLFGARG
jgi:hypothetical protein